MGFSPANISSQAHQNDTSLVNSVNGTDTPIKPNQHCDSRTVKGLAYLFVDRPVGWAFAGFAIFFSCSSTLPNLGWNAIEIMLGKNLLSGLGYVVAPLDPPAVWRPVLGSFYCAVVELFAEDPFRIFQLIYASCLTVLLVFTFLIAREVWSLRSAHFACFLLISTPAFTWFLTAGHHCLSHIAFMSVIGPAVLLTIKCLKDLKTHFCIGAGLFWGLAALGRPDAALFFVASIIALCHKHFRDGDWRSLIFPMLAVVGSFLIVMVPYTMLCRLAEERYGLLGQKPILIFYMGYGHVVDLGFGDFDRLGYEYCLNIYGSPEENNYSLLRVIWSEPLVFIHRVLVNAYLYGRLLINTDLMSPTLLAATVISAFCSRLSQLPYVVRFFFPALLMTFLAILVFHVDGRYALIAAPVIVWTAAGATEAFSHMYRAEGRTSATKMFMVALAVAVLSAHAALSWESMRFRQTFLPQKLTALKKLAADFTNRVENSPPKVLYVEFETGAGFDTWSQFVVSYWAGTGLAWDKMFRWYYRREHGESLLPRDKIYSMTSKPPDYVYVPEAIAAQYSKLGRFPSLGKTCIEPFGCYRLFRYSHEMGLRN